MRERKGAFAEMLRQVINTGVQHAPVNIGGAPLKIIEGCEVLAVIGTGDDDTEEPEIGPETCGVWLRVRLPGKYNNKEVRVRCAESVSSIYLNHGNPSQLVGMFCDITGHGQLVHHISDSGYATIRDSFPVRGGKPVGSSDETTTMYSIDSLANLGSIPTNAAEITNESWNKPHWTAE